MTTRQNQRRRFLAKHQWADAQIAPLTPDASFRRYWRLRQDQTAAMLMDAPPPENVGAFVTITRHLQRLGARVPAIYAFDSEHGFLLLEDLGDQTFTRLLADGHEPAALYRRAVGTLSRIRQHPEAADIKLPEYDSHRALAEANLLLDWYLPARLQRPVDANARDAFQQLWTQMLGALPPLNSTLVLRDYHVDNLMMNSAECALLDYQDAVIGSPAYDLASLLEDARLDIAAPLAEQMRSLYLEQNRDLERHKLHQHYVVWAAQRHCKVAGIFVRLWLRDGKDAYLRHLPRVMDLLHRHIHEAALEPLRGWLGEHLGEPRHIGFDDAPERLLRYCKVE